MKILQLDEGYFQIAKQRIENCNKKDSTFLRVLVDGGKYVEVKQVQKMRQ